MSRVEKSEEKRKGKGIEIDNGYKRFHCLTTTYKSIKKKIFNFFFTWYYSFDKMTNISRPSTSCQMQRPSLTDDDDNGKHFLSKSLVVESGQTKQQRIT